MEPVESFDWIEYFVFGGMLVTSAGIGVYFGCKGGQDTVSGYLFGGKELSVFPVALSLITGCISGITLLGIPTEVYTYGTMILVQFLSQIVAAIICLYLIIPVFYELQLVSIFQYMELRFGQNMRKLISSLSILSQLLYLPIVLYGPALALNEVTGVNIHILSSLICTICIIYTTLLFRSLNVDVEGGQIGLGQANFIDAQSVRGLTANLPRYSSSINFIFIIEACQGGLKAVVWTDTIQGIFMVASVLAVLFLGIKSEGGLDRVWQSGIRGDRFEFFKFDMNPTTRISFLYFFLSQICTYLFHYGYNPTTVQRYMALPSLKKARQACIYMLVGLIFFLSLCGSIGIVLYAAYQDCDPISAGMISKPDQILPLYILKFSKIIPGLPAIFLSGVVSAALSTLSACFNTFSGVIYEDFIESCFRKKPSEKASSLIMKLIVVILGAVCLLLILIVEKLGTVYELAMSMGGAIVGVTLGIFFMGTFLPWVTKKGAYVGGAVGLATMSWLEVGSNLAKTSGKIHYDPKPMSVSGCDFNVTITSLLNSTQITDESDVFYPFRISPFNYYLVAFMVTTFVGLIVSFATGANDLSKIDPDLFVPIIRGKLGVKKNKDIVYDSVPLQVQCDLTKESCDTSANT